MAAKVSGGVQSVERVFELLELITDAGGNVTLSELAASTSLPLPTIHRLLRTLASMGYVRQLEDRRYALGAKLVRLGEMANKQFAELARPQLMFLVRELGETANLAILDFDKVMYVAQVPSPHAMRMFTEVGRRVHAHDTGVGKAILSQLDDDAVREIVKQSGMPAATSHSLRTVPDLLENLRITRERGYSLDDGEQELGVKCLAVPVPHTGTPMAISVSGPAARVDDAFGVRAVPLLQQAAAEIGELAKAS